MFADTQPAELDAAGGPDAWAAFRVDHPQEQLVLLRQLRDGSVPVHLSGPGGCALTTLLWSVDEGGVGFSVDAGSPQLAGLLEGDEAVVVAYLDAVKLQFDLHHLVLVRGPRSATLRCSLPGTIYRFQRRQSYRVRPPQGHAPAAHLRHPAIREMPLALRVLDVSVGGCALWQPEDVPPIAAGSQIAGAEITLDADTRFATALTVLHVSSPAPGGRGVRLGCEWQLPGPAERSLQRWIDQAQRRRRLLALG